MLTSFSFPLDYLKGFLPFAVVIGVLCLRGIVKYLSLVTSVELAPESIIDSLFRLAAHALSVN